MPAWCPAFDQLAALHARMQGLTAMGLKIQGIAEKMAHPAMAQLGGGNFAQLAAMGAHPQLVALESVLALQELTARGIGACQAAFAGVPPWVLQCSADVPAWALQLSSKMKKDLHENE
jgi:hypothetical protein